MTIRRRTLAQAAALLALPSLSADLFAQRAKDSLVLGMVLEPTSLDPTSAPAAAIGEIVHYNVLEGLTKISAAGAVMPLLAEDWSSEPDGKSYTFKLRKGVKFQDGTAFDAAAVKFSFERAKAPDSTNKAKKGVFDNISSISTPDPLVVILTLNNPDATLPFRLGENTAVILSPQSAATTATQPVGTGPYRLDSWQKGSAVTLAKWDGYRDAGAIKLRRVTFRFINDNAAQVAALLAGDIDGMPRFGAVQNIKQFQADKRFTVEIGSTAGKGILAINNKKKPLDDVRVRRAIMHAIDRQAFIDGVLEGLGKPIGSHATPADVGYVDLTGVYPFNPDKARALLKEAGEQPAEPEFEPAAAQLRSQRRRGGGGDAGQGGHHRQDRKRRMGAVAGRAVQGQFRPDHHQPCRAAGLHAVRQPAVLLGLRQQGLQRAGQKACRGRSRQGASGALRRPPAPDHHRRGQRLHLQFHPGGDRAQGLERAVGQLADSGQ